MVAEHELIDSLPRLAPMKGAFQEYVDANLFDVIGTSGAEREAGIKIEFHVLHLHGGVPSHHLLEAFVDCWFLTTKTNNKTEWREPAVFLPSQQSC